MDVDTVVQSAARAALDSDHPVRVIENGELVGVVDDEAILRVVVAEEDAPAGRCRHDHPDRGPSRRPTAPPPSRPRAAAPRTFPRHGCWPASASSGSCWRSSFQGKDTLVIGGADQVGVAELARRPGQRHRARRQRQLVHLDHALDRRRARRRHQWLQLLISTPAFPSPYPQIGFLGVLAIAWFVTALVAGWRMSLLTAVCFALFSLLGFYEDSMDLLIVTLLAVALSVGDRAAARGAGWRTAARARAVITPILDVMQTLPSFTYLLPLMLLFGIGAAGRRRSAR